ncbi:ABC transporter permease [Pseudozobellia thermophila]|uniref:ABC-2 type transport system permease protein n=1 Tax=Pseudozobellia thermophila TaxID=192903 RepID=A0A1M6CLC6_9FLAO|nr:ABC transporter permease [Pseudozobellia thermophila]SHI61723.1 ABC-2 type transport system permease protein [Pseudozobellia thermophila]
MHKLRASAYKEFLLLTRDPGGLAILFIMPLLLVITITVIQNATFKTLKQSKIPILLVDYDQGNVSASIRQNLAGSDQFEVVEEADETKAQELVGNGTYQLALVIPENLSRNLDLKVNRNVEGLLQKFGIEGENGPLSKSTPETKEVKLYFDPATQFSFRNSIKSGIDQMVSKIETQTIYRAFQKELTDDPSEEIFDTAPFIKFTEIIPGDTLEKNSIPNATQHNIPAWTLFAIFFIILPLSINMVKEKNLGTFVRLRTNPVSYVTVLGGKTVIFLSVALIQFALMLLVGVFLFPLIGLPRLEVEGRLPLLFLVAFFAGLAAVGLGLLLGTIAKSQEQSAPFGATFVVILAALGGVWVPVFAMPAFMQALSNLSPMNWGLNAFYNVFLRNVGITELFPDLALLFLFFLITTAISIIYNQRKNAV